MKQEFQIGQLVTVRNNGIKKPGRILDLKHSRNWAVVGWKVKSRGLHLLATKKIKISRLELYVEPPKKSIIHAIISFFKPSRA